MAKRTTADISVVVGMDASDVQKESRRINKEFNNTKRILKRAETGVEKYQKQLGSLKTSLAAGKINQQEFEKGLRHITKEYEKGRRAAKRYNDETKKAAKRGMLGGGPSAGRGMGGAAMAGAARLAGPMLAGYGITRILTAIPDTIQKGFRESQRLNDTGEQLGIAAKELRTLRLTLSTMTGFDEETITDQLLDVRERLGEINEDPASALGKAAASFGLNAAELIGKDVNTQLAGIVTALKAIPDAETRNFRARELFGDEAAKLLTSTAANAEEFARLNKEFAEMNLGMTKSEQEEAKKANEELVKAYAAVGNDLKMVAMRLAPVVARLAEIARYTSGTWFDEIFPDLFGDGASSYSTNAMWDYMNPISGSQATLGSRANNPEEDVLKRYKYGNAMGRMVYQNDRMEQQLGKSNLDNMLQAEASLKEAVKNADPDMTQVERLLMVIQSVSAFQGASKRFDTFNDAIRLYGPDGQMKGVTQDFFENMMVEAAGMSHEDLKLYREMLEEARETNTGIHAIVKAAVDAEDLEDNTRKNYDEAVRHVYDRMPSIYDENQDYDIPAMEAAFEAKLEEMGLMGAGGAGLPLLGDLEGEEKEFFDKLGKMTSAEVEDFANTDFYNQGDPMGPFRPNYMEADDNGGGFAGPEIPSWLLTQRQRDRQEEEQLFKDLEEAFKEGREKEADKLIKKAEEDAAEFRKRQDEAAERAEPLAAPSFDPMSVAEFQFMKDKALQAEKIAEEKRMKKEEQEFLRSLNERLVNKLDDLLGEGNNDFGGVN